jgi:hypothetical protein
MRLKLILTVLTVFVPMLIVAEERGRMACKGFIGGMMIHSGYVWSRNVAYSVPGGGTLGQSINAVPLGIGGAIKLQFGDHLRIGSEGYVTNVSYGEYGSHASIGWGGVLCEYYHSFKKCRLFAGGLVGGGSERNVANLSENNMDFSADEPVSHRKYSFMAIDPYLGVEIPLNQKVNLVLKTDCLLNATNPQADYFTGPRIFIGFMFGHSRN